MQASSLYMGIEIGGTKLQLVLGDRSGRIIHRRRALVDRAAGGEGIRRQIERLSAELLADHRPAAVGLGFGGPIDWRTGRTRCSHQVQGWNDFPLAQWLRDLTHLPVAVDNDANVAALGEALSGAGRGAQSTFFITLGSGVGGGLASDGAIFHGQSPGECEFGQLHLDRQGTTVESRCSGWAIDRRIRALKENNTKSLLCDLIGATPGGEARHLSAALTANDPAACTILAELADDLGYAFSHVTHLLHPEVIVLGGGLSLVGEPLRAAVAQRLPMYIMSAFLPGPKVCLAGLGEDSVPVGAVHLAAAAHEQG